MKPEYVFIVGLPRTGTKLMVNVLERAQDRYCRIAPENFFLGRVLRPGVRQRMRKIGDMSIDASVHQFVDDMYAGKFFGTYWDRLRRGYLGVEKETMRQHILASGRSDKEIYSILLQIYAEAGDHREEIEGFILGDKSGPHLYHVPALMEWFPEAKIIHTLRDPRAILASEHRKLLSRRLARLEKAGNKKQVILLKLQAPLLSLSIVLYITIAWLYAVRLHHKYKKNYSQNYYLSKFEELVNEPEKSLRSLCDFLGIGFDDAMLHPPNVDSSYSKEVNTGFDKRTLNRWRHDLKPWMSVLLRLCGRKYLREFDYVG